SHEERDRTARRRGRWQAGARLSRRRPRVPGAQDQGWRSRQCRCEHRWWTRRRTTHIGPGGRLGSAATRPGHSVHLRRSRAPTSPLTPCAQAPLALEDPMATDLTQTICKIIADVLEIDTGGVAPEHHFVNDLGANSLDVVEFVMRLEDHFDIEIPDAAADQIHAVGDLVGFVKRMLADDDHT